MADSDKQKHFLKSVKRSANYLSAKKSDTCFKAFSQAETIFCTDWSWGKKIFFNLNLQIIYYSIKSSNIFYQIHLIPSKFRKKNKKTTTITVTELILFLFIFKFSNKKKLSKIEIYISTIYNFSILKLLVKLIKCLTNW